ncbi:MAG: hypothetical protein DRO99_02880 [Candidatus Aenigmatarchaeota archaeon]|nr:MAG: hypothetical protein DRO99_02880 [Candidatus Aenigmarchaeota archaeon]
MECRKDENLRECTCTYPGCSRKGVCCECIAHHRKNGEIPGGLFPLEAEKGYDRPVGTFIKAVSG